MKLHYLILAVAVAAALASCSPKIGMQTSQTYPPRDPAEAFAFVSDKHAVPLNAANLGSYSTKGLPGDSSAHYINAKIATQAQGGNAFYVTYSDKDYAPNSNNLVYELDGYMLRMPSGLEIATIRGAKVVGEAPPVKAAVDSTSKMSVYTPAVSGRSTANPEMPVYATTESNSGDYNGGRFRAAIDMGYGIGLSGNGSGGPSKGLILGVDLSYYFPKNADLGFGAAFSGITTKSQDGKENISFFGPTLSGLIDDGGVTKFAYALGAGYLSYVAKTNNYYDGGRVSAGAFGAYLSGGLDFMFTRNFGLGLKVNMVMGPFSKNTKIYSENYGYVSAGNPFNELGYFSLSYFSFSGGVRFLF